MWLLLTGSVLLLTDAYVEKFMLATSNLVAFVATAQPDNARVFYQEILGLTLMEDTPFALVFSCGAVTLRIQKLATFTPAACTALGWEVAEIKEVVASLTAKGIVLERYDQMPQDASGIWTTPEGAKVAWFKDPDGNTLSLTQLASG